MDGKIEQERERLLRMVQERLPQKLREQLRDVVQTPVRTTVVVSSNEVGSDHADSR